MNKSRSAVKEPLVRIVRRDKIPLRKAILLYACGVLFALLLGVVLIACMGKNPIEFFSTVFATNFSNGIYFSSLVKVWVPLLVTSLGVSIAFKLRFWNIGAEGQFLIGALSALTASLLIGDKLPHFLNVLIVLAAGAVGGGLWGVIVGFFKVKFKTNETLLTLMFNYIALYIVLSIETSSNDFYMIKLGGFPSFRQLAQLSRLTVLTIGDIRIDVGIFIAIVLLVLLIFYFRKMKQGYEISVVGDSPRSAEYAGMNVKKITLRTVFLSAAVIGLAGAMLLAGNGASNTMSSGITSGVGWTAIIVAWLSKLNPIGIFLVSFLMSMLNRGTSIARGNMQISLAVADILQGLILFSVLAVEFFIRFKVVFRKKKQVDELSTPTTVEKEEVK